MKQLELSLVNEILQTIFTTNLNYRIPSDYEVIEEFKEGHWRESGYDKTGEHKWILKYKDVFIEVTEFSDSYGSVEEKTLVQFVVPQETVITKYTPVK